MSNLMSFLSLSLGRIIQFLLVFITIKVMTTLLSPEEVGRYYLLLAIITGIVFFFINPIGLFVNRRINAWRNQSLIRQYFFILFFYLFCISIISILLIYFFINEYIKLEISFLWIVCLIGGSVLFNSINTTSIPALNLLGYPIKYITLIVITVSISLVSATFFVYLYDFNYKYWFLGIVFGQLLTGILGTYYLFINTSGKISLDLKKILTKNKLKNVLRFAWPISVSATLIWIHFQSYRFIIQSYINLYELGIFVAGFSIGVSLIAAIELILGSFLLPKFYKSIENVSDEKTAVAWSSYTEIFLPSLILGGITIIVLSPELTKIFLGPEFQISMEYIFWGVVCEIARVVFGIYSLIAHAKMNTSWLIIPAAVGALLSLLLSFLFINFFASHGAGLGITLSGFSSIIFIHFFLKQKLNFILPWSLIFRAFAYSFLLYILDSLIRQNLIFEGSMNAFILIIIYLLLFCFISYLFFFKIIKNYE